MSVPFFHKIVATVLIPACWSIVISGTAEYACIAMTQKRPANKTVASGNHPDPEVFIRKKDTSAGITYKKLNRPSRKGHAFALIGAAL